MDCAKSLNKPEIRSSKQEINLIIVKDDLKSLIFTNYKEINQKSILRRLYLFKN